MSSCDKIIPVESLPTAEEANTSDQLIIQHNDTTNILDIEDFILDLDNTTFEGELSQLLVDTEDLISGTIRVIATYALLKEWTNLTGSVVPGQVVYVVAKGNIRSDYDNGGFFVFIDNNLSKEVPGIKMKHTKITGHWARINYKDINVKWFGVIDDPGVDNGPKIQEALDYGAMVNKKVRFPTFRKKIICTTPINVPSNTTIVGDNTHIHCITPAHALFNIIDKSNISISNLTLDGDPVVTGSGGMSSGADTALIYIQDSTHVKISNCTIQNSEKWGLGVNRSKYCTVTNNRFLSNKSFGVVLYDSDTGSTGLYTASYNIISQNIIEGNGATGGGVSEACSVMRTDVGYNCIIANTGPDRVESTVADNTSVVTTVNYNEGYSS
jgi:parallel beta-helix repeat protein